MNGWTLWQYRNVAESFLAQCESDEQMHEELLSRLGTLLEKGNQCERPVSEYVEDGLFALRGKSKTVQARLMFYFGEKKQIIFVHAFYKTTPKISRHDIEIGKRNRRFIEEEREKRYGFNLPT